MCPRGEIGRHKGLKLALLGVSSSLAEGTKKMIKPFISDNNQKSLKIKEILKIFKNNF